MMYSARSSGSLRGLLALGVSLAVLASSHAFVFASFAGPNNQSQAESVQAGLLSAAAVVTEAGIRIEWRAKFEADNLGFNVYRQLKTGKRVRLNREIIPGAAFVAGPNDPRSAPQNIAAGGGLSYSWSDPAGTKDSVYYIESVSLDGVLRLHEGLTPVAEGQAPASKPLPPIKVGPAQTSDISSADDAGANQVGYPAAFPERGAAPPSSPALLQDQWAIAAQTGLKIAIKKVGWYRVTQPQMAAAGFNPSVDIRNLQLFVDSQELAISTSRSGGLFGPTDYIEFFGSGLDVATTDLRTYYLIAAATPGKRVGGEIQVDVPPPPVAPPSPAPTPQPTPVPATSPAPKSTWSRWLWAKFVVSVRYPMGGGPVVPIIDWRGEASPKTTAVNSPAPVASAPAIVVARDARVVDAAAPAAPIVSKKKTARKQKKKRQRRQQRAEPRREYSHALAGSGLAPSNFEYTIERKDRGVHFSSLLNGDAENWFGQVISNGPKSQIISTPNPASGATGTARLEIRLQGVNFVTHQVGVQFNDVPLGSFTFFGTDGSVQVWDIPVSLLQSAGNTLVLTPPPPCPPSQCFDTTIVDYVRVTYPHSFQADSGSLKFNLLGSQTRKVDGFATPLVRLIDYTDPLNVTMVKPVAETSALGYAITVPRSASGSKTPRALYALPQAQFDAPAALSLNQPSTLNLNSNTGDFLIISHQTLIPSLTANVLPLNTSLVAQRQSQGFVPKVVDVDDVYDEFGFGLHGPQAIKAFLLHASTNWASPPRYVIFAGDASLDPRNYSLLGNFDLVPTKLVDATYNETASDDWLTDFNDDGVGDIPVGRLPLRTLADMDLVVSKIVNYDHNVVPNHALLVADDPGNPPFWDFESGSDNVQALLPGSMAVQKSYRRLEVKVLTGTISASSSSTTVTGTGTLFTTELLVGRQLHKATGEPLGAIATIDSATSLTLALNAASTHTGAYGKQDDPTATANIIAGMNQGRAIVNYSGHGNVNVWTGAGLFTATHATALTNGNKLSFVIVMDCLNGYYHDPALVSLADAFLKAPNGGAVAVFASSGLTVTFGQREMELELYWQLYGGAPMALGDAIKIGKTASSDIDVRRTWIFFGDPSLKIR